VLADEQLTANEVLWLRLLESCKTELSLISEQEEGERIYKWSRDRPAARTLIIGSGPAWGWTDGKTYVAVDRSFLETLKFDFDGFTRVGNLLLHEFCHSEADTAEHVHGVEFYQLFHDSSMSIGAFVQACVRRFPKAAQDVGRHLSKKMLTLQDQDVAIEAAATKFGKAAPNVAASEKKKHG